MSIEKGRAYFRQFGMEDRVREFTVSSATVELAALALGVEGARIAKTLSFKKDDSCILILAAGDARIDNRKFKDKFHMCSPAFCHGRVDRQKQRAEVRSLFCMCKGKEITGQ